MKKKQNYIIFVIHTVKVICIGIENSFLLQNNVVKHGTIIDCNVKIAITSHVQHEMWMHFNS